MPVVVVTAPPLPSPEEELAALGRLTGAVAAALGLPAEGVFATTVATGAGVLGTEPAAWPVVVLHGGPRDAAAMRAAAHAAEASVRASWQAGEVWVQWAVREDPSS